MKRLITVIFICLLICVYGVACVPSETVGIGKEFTSVLYDEKVNQLPMRIYYFRFMQDEPQVEICNVDMFDYDFVANKVLRLLNKHISAVDLRCIDCKIINNIAIIDLEKDFEILSDDHKLLVASSLIKTFGEVEGLQYVLIYANGSLIKLDFASNVYLSPCEADKSVTPLSMKERVLHYNELINVGDDVAMPMLLWVNTKQGVPVPTVGSIPFINTYIDSVVNEMFTNDGRYPYISPGKLLRDPYIEGNSLYIEITEDSEANINFNAILKTLKQYHRDARVVLKRSDTDEEIVYSSYDIASGMMLDHYTPNSNGFSISEVGVEILNGDIIYSVADYCIESLDRLNNNQEKLLYDAWFSKDHICISVTEAFVKKMEGLKPDEQRGCIYSVVNTMCRNLSVTSVRFLVDGYTVKNIGVINTENPINFI